MTAPDRLNFDRKMADELTDSALLAALQGVLADIGVLEAPHDSSGDFHGVSDHVMADTEELLTSSSVTPDASDDARRGGA